MKVKNKAGIWKAVVLMVVCLSVTLVFCGCSSRKSDLEGAVKYVKTVCVKVAKNYGIEQTGGQMQGFVNQVAGFIDAEKASGRGAAVGDFSIQPDRPRSSWSVVVRLLKYGENEHELVVEGYGDDLAKPLYEEKFTVTPGPRP